MIFLALPFVFVIFVINFPAGLLVYWITTNLWTIVQQAIVRKRLGPLRPATADGEAPPMSIMDRMLHRGSTGAKAEETRDRAPAGVATGNSRGSSPQPQPKKSRPSSSPPPPSPRKKKKRSGRRR
jgi:YidC/Oxa1 family membrane protein insertase